MKFEGNKDKPAEILSFEWPKRRDEKGNGEGREEEPETSMENGKGVRERR